MAFRLTKAERAERDAMAARLADIKDRVERSVDAANALIEQMVASVNAEIEAYNDVLAEAAELAESVGGSARDAIDAKSEKWQEGAAGLAASEWADAWEGEDFSQVELVEAESIDAPDLDHAEALTQLPEALNAD